VKDFEIWADDGFDDRVRDVFALQLYDDPKFHIIYDGVEVDARAAIAAVTPYPISVSLPGGKKLEATLEIVEWKRPVERKLMLCLPGRFSFHDMSPGIQARGFEFTSYLTAQHFQALADDNTEGLVELDPGSNLMIEAAKAKLREHFKSKEVERSRDKIQEWVDAKIYPYEGAAADPIEVNERQLFDVVALNLADFSNEFEKSPPKQKALVLQLIKSAIETGASNLLSILEKVIDLPKARQDELADLLRKTSLTAVINAAKAVTDRLEFLRALQILVFEPQSKRQLLERSQLHRIIAQETWIFGEQYNLMNDDEDLTSVLRSHLRVLGSDRVELGSSDPVVDADGKAAIVDLMLSSRMPTPTDDERRHLVVELIRQRWPMSTRPTARPSDLLPTWPALRGFCRSTAMEAIDRWPRPGRCAWPSAGPMCAVASMSWPRLDPRRSPPRRLYGSRRFTPSRPISGAERPRLASPPGRRRPSL